MKLTPRGLNDVGGLGKNNPGSVLIFLGGFFSVTLANTISHMSSCGRWPKEKLLFKFVGNSVTCGLYYKCVMIVIDAPSVVSK